MMHFKLSAGTSLIISVIVLFIIRKPIRYNFEEATCLESHSHPLSENILV